LTDIPRGRVRFSLQPPRSLLGRAGVALAVAVLAVLAFFFLVIFLAAGALFAAIFLARWWWVSRQARRAQRGTAIEGEYVVVTHGGEEVDLLRQPAPPGSVSGNGDKP